jgi:hypothetical protein
MELKRDERDGVGEEATTQGEADAERHATSGSVVE